MGTRRMMPKALISAFEKPMSWKLGNEKERSDDSLTKLHFIVLP
jgi:hypothetical protein